MLAPKPYSIVISWLQSRLSFALPSCVLVVADQAFIIPFMTQTSHLPQLRDFFLCHFVMVQSTCTSLLHATQSSPVSVSSRAGQVSGRWLLACVVDESAGCTS